MTGYLNTITKIVAEAVERHKYVLPGGVCVCGHDTEAKEGQYQRAWRDHMVEKVAIAVHVYAMDHEHAGEEVVAKADTWTLVTELVKRGFLKAELKPASEDWDNTVPRELAGVLEDREDESSARAAAWLAEHENDDAVWYLIGSLLDQIIEMADR